MSKFSVISTQLEKPRDECVAHVVATALETCSSGPQGDNWTSCQMLVNVLKHHRCRQHFEEPTTLAKKFEALGNTAAAISATDNSVTDVTINISTQSYPDALIALRKARRDARV